METERTVSVVDREFLLGPLRTPCISLTLHHPPDETFVTEHLPDLGYDIEELQVFHWKLQGWTKLGSELTSNEFDCGGHTW